MIKKNSQSAARIAATSFGILSGLGGITHGVGEILQGNIATNGLVIHSWTQGPIATNMGGEPALTILPNLLVTGITAVLVSIGVIVWSLVFPPGRGGQILLLLSVAMLLVGGGFGPPIIGILAGIAGLGSKPHHRWLTRLPANIRRFFASLWPWVFAVCLINGIFLVVGSVILVSFFGMNNPDLFVNSFLLTIPSLLVLIFTGAAYDADKQIS